MATHFGHDLRLVLSNRLVAFGNAATAGGTGVASALFGLRI
jgi:hypothetical protein